MATAKNARPPQRARGEATGCVFDDPHLTSFGDIGRQLGISRQRAEQLCHRALKKLEIAFAAKGVTRETLSEWLPR